jgi:hypothetical protein
LILPVSDCGTRKGAHKNDRQVMTLMKIMGADRALLQRFASSRGRVFPHPGAAPMMRCGLRSRQFVKLGTGKITEAAHGRGDNLLSPKAVRA